MTNIDEVIELGQTTLPSSAPRHPLVPFPFASFGQLLFEAFLRTNKIGYLNESITVEFLSVRQYSSGAPRHFVTVDFPGFFSSAPCSFQVTVRKTWMKRWNYSPSLSRTDVRSCLTNSSWRAPGHLLRDVPNTPPSPQRTRALCH